MQSYARRGVHGQTVEILAHRVLSGQIPEGTTLDIAALRHELGVSLTALRESLKVLAAKGMVDARQRRGTFVRPRTDWNLLDADVLRWQFKDRRLTAADRALLCRLAEVRSIVKPAAARLAALRRTEADLDAMRTALTALQQDNIPDETLKADQAFHGALMAAAHNELLERMDAMIALCVNYRDDLTHRTHARTANLLTRLRPVYEAVRAQDPDMAERAMRDLLAEDGEAADKPVTADRSAHPDLPYVSEGSDKPALALPAGRQRPRYVTPD
ncbi:FadR/GntR family transcriptional regulator [Streptomyces aureus]|uniref:FadR/GntR family transcriptional regulator n=1 Tax=Streptomyces aureus TaxID=193461 RepID=UPI0033F75245